MFTMKDTVEPDRSRSATWGDLSEHTATLLRDNDRQRVDIEHGLRLVRAELRDDALHIGRQLRSDLAQTRHELAAQLDSLTDHLEALLARRDARLLGAVVLAHLVLMAVMLATEVA